MSKEKDNKRVVRKGVVDEINDSLYALAAYLSEYVHLLRASGEKTTVR